MEHPACWVFPCGKAPPPKPPHPPPDIQLQAFYSLGSSLGMG